MTRAVLAFAAYVAAIVAANWLTSTFGMVWVAPGLMVTAGTYAAGAALLARDVVQDVAGKRWVLAGIVVGIALSWVTSDPHIALASACAFAVAELADFAVYTPLRHKGWARAVLVSNAIGAVLDTIVFLSVAGFPVTAQGVTGQLIGKLLWATALPVAVILAGRRVAQARA